MPGCQPWRRSPVPVQHACPPIRFRVRVRRPGPAVRPSGVHPSSVRPCGVHLSSVQPSGVRPRPSGRVRLLPPQAVALGTRWVRRGNLHHGNESRSQWLPRRPAARSTAEAWMTRATLPRSRWSVECRRRTRPGWVRAVAAARARCPARQARPASERPWLAAARWARSRLQREVAAPAAWLACWGWVGDHGAWLSWNLPPGWTGPAGPMGLPAGMGVRPQRGPGWRRAFAACCRQRSDLW
jgi:hypothetical protein